MYINIDMFAFVGSLFKIAFYGLLINEYLKNKHSEKYNEFIISASYNLIYFYSKGQIFLIHANKYLTNFYKFIETKSANYKTLETPENSDKPNTIEYIFNNKQIYKADFSLEQKGPSEYDFIIVTENDNKEHPYTNKRILKKIEDWNNSFEESNIKFFLVEVQCQNELIPIDFKTGDYNFYLVNNVIDEKFIIYFLTTYYSEKVKDIDLQTAGVSIFDHNIIKFNYNIKNDYIYITKTNYFRKSDIITED